MIRTPIAVTAVLALLWSVAVWMTGGGTLTFGGFASHRPIPLDR